jgi:CPA1 family monovalent cation:H+ antiporter
LADLIGASASGVEGIIGLLLVTALVAVAVRFVRFSYTVALVLTGLVLAFLPGMPHLQLTPGIILIVFLPVLLFYGAYNLDADEVRAAIRPITLLAVPGVVATAALVGGALRITTGLTWQESLLFGTIVAATDPVAVLATFAELGAPRRLATIVTSESLFNDGTALVLFASMLGLATSHTVSVGDTIEHFGVQLVGSLAVGAAIGLLGTTLVQRMDEALIETLLTLIIAYGGYLLTSALGLSGPLETVTAGLVFGTRGVDIMSPTTRLQAGATWEFLDFLANSLLFLLMGLALRPIGEATASHLGSGVWWPLLVAIVAVLVVRVMVVWGVDYVLDRAGHGLPDGWATLLAWSGLRGAVSLAAVLSLPLSLPRRDLLLTLTYGVVLFTIVVQGLTISPLLERLGLGRDEGSRLQFELLLGRLRALDASTREVETLQSANEIDEHLAHHLLDEYGARRTALRRELDSTLHADGTLEQEHRRAVLRRLLRVQHEAARNTFARGQIGQSALRQLTADIDAEWGKLDLSSDTEAASRTEPR